jgi:hypothetical protein
VSQTISLEIDADLLMRLRDRRPGISDQELLESTAKAFLGRELLRRVQRHNMLTEDEAIALGVEAVDEARASNPAARNPPTPAASFAMIASVEQPHVKLSGDIEGAYVVEETRDDGSLVVAPDTSAKAIMERLGHKPATLAEFEAAHGAVRPPDGDR